MCPALRCLSTYTDVDPVTRRLPTYTQSLVDVLCRFAGIILCIVEASEIHHSSEHLLEKIGFDESENELCKIRRLHDDRYRRFMTAVQREVRGFFFSFFKLSGSELPLFFHSVDSAVRSRRSTSDSVDVGECRKASQSAQLTAQL